MAIPRNLGNLAQGADTAGVLGPTKGGTGLTTVGTNGQVLQSNGSALVFATPATTSPAGSTGQVQYNNAGAFGAVSSGTSGQVLTSAGTGAVPTWENPSSPYTLVSTTNVAGVTNMDFNSLPALYNGGYMLVLDDVLPSNDYQTLRIYYFQSGSIYTGNQIRWSMMQLNNGVGSITGATNATEARLTSTDVSVASGEGSAGICGTVNFKIQTNRNNTITSDLNYINAGGLTGTRVIGQNWLQTTSYFPLTGVRLRFDSGTAASGIIRLYGVNL